MRTFVALVCLIGVLASAACTPAAAPSSATAPQKDTAAAPAAGKTGASASEPAKTSSNIDDLYQAAKKEGEVVWQRAWEPERYQDIEAAFNKKYPGIKITGITLPPDASAARIITEAQAKRVTIDVIYSNMNRLTPIVERDLVETMDLAAYGVDPKEIMLDGKMLFGNDGVFGVLYNTKLVAEKDVPKKWEDLLDPKWKGKIIVNKGAAGWIGLGSIWDDAKIEAYLKELNKQNLQVGAKGTDIFNSLARGEAAITNGVPMNSAAPEMLKGAPVALAPIGPLQSTPGGSLVVKNSPHPNAAKLLQIFLGLPEGRQLLKDGEIGYHVTPCGKFDVEQALCNKGLEIFSLDTIQKVKNAETTTNLAAKVLGLDK